MPKSYVCNSSIVSVKTNYILIQSCSSVLLQYLAAGVVPIKLPTPCINLRHLSLCIDFDDLKKILAALCLLKSSPNLRKLEIIVSTRLVWLDFAFLFYLWLHLHILFLFNVIKLWNLQFFFVLSICLVSILKSYSLMFNI